MIIPQTGFQMKFLSSPAQIVIGGGSAGGGKTYALLMEALRFSDDPNFGGVIFRRTSPQIKNQGGLWDNSQELFMKLPNKPTPVQFNLLWRFASGGKLRFSHLQYENDKYSWQGAQIPFIGFDELTHFSESQFFYLVSRNRSPFGIPSYVRSTCNPDPSSWVKKFIEWWIYPDDYHIEVLQGMPIPERDGIVRYFTRDGNSYIWGNSRKEVILKAPHIFKDIQLLKSLKDAGVMPESLVKSATFVFGDVYGNKQLLKNDPNYLGNLMSQDSVEKNRLLKGSWKLIEDEYKLFRAGSVADCYSNDFIPGGKKYITADIAFEGSDLFVVGVWDGLRLIDITAIDKSDSERILQVIREKKKLYSVAESHIIYDADGVGGFLKGFYKNAISFKNGSAAIIDSNYDNLKTECYFLLAQYIEDRKIFIAPTIYSDSINQELDAIRKKPYDGVGKIRILSKPEIKVHLGRSPDFADMLMMRMYPELNKPKTVTRVSSF